MDGYTFEFYKTLGLDVRTTRNGFCVSTTIGEYVGPSLADYQYFAEEWGIPVSRL